MVVMLWYAEKPSTNHHFLLLLFLLQTVTCLKYFLLGGSGPWRSDGSCPESHGEILSSRLVWKVRDERSPSSDQKVGVPLCCCVCLCFPSVSALVQRGERTGMGMFGRDDAGLWFSYFGLQFLHCNSSSTRHSFQMLYPLRFRLRDHVNDKTKLPILIFPEGKCDHAERLKKKWMLF